MWYSFVFFQAEDGIRDLVRSRGLGDVYKRQVEAKVTATDDVLVVGAPKLTMTYSGTTPGEASTLSLIHI